jgi:hypothetical protein
MWLVRVELVRAVCEGGLNPSALSPRWSRVGLGIVETLARTRPATAASLAARRGPGCATLFQMGIACLRRPRTKESCHGPGEC